MRLVTVAEFRFPFSQLNWLEVGFEEGGEVFVLHHLVSISI